MPTPSGVAYHRTCLVRLMDKWDEDTRRLRRRDGQFRQAAKVTSFTMDRFAHGRGPRALTPSEGMAVGHLVHVELARGLRASWRASWPEAAKFSDEQVAAARRVLRGLLGD